MNEPFAARAGSESAGTPRHPAPTRRWFLPRPLETRTSGGQEMGGARGGHRRSEDEAFAGPRKGQLPTVMILLTLA